MFARMIYKIGKRKRINSSNRKKNHLEKIGRIISICIYFCGNKKENKPVIIRIMSQLNEKQTRKISKFLSLILRHAPEKIGLQLDAQGWANVDELLAKAAKGRMRISREVLDEVVATNDKKRFAFSEDGQRIRANQGHSIGIELGLEPVTPPDLLYHGTVQRFLPAIMADGLKKMTRDHVHLSKDLETAINVGNRRGQAFILTVRAGEMHAQGHTFYLSANGVWLTEEVPPQFIDQS